MAAAASIFGIMESLAVQCAAFQAALLLASGLHKLVRRHRTRTVVHEFAGVPRHLAPFAVAAAAAAELSAGLLLLTPSLRAAGGAVAALIWGIYLWLIVRAIAQGRRDVDCGCTFGVARRPLGAYQVTRNGILTGTALLVTAVSAAGPVTATQIVAAFALLALYGALDQVMALQPLRPGELS
jgi:uncharacterized membrane protein YphA (DoxX/SURF4 family)